MIVDNYYIWLNNTFSEGSPSSKTFYKMGILLRHAKPVILPVLYYFELLLVLTMADNPTTLGLLIHITLLNYVLTIHVTTQSIPIKIQFTV
jgi:hypothetical protein